MGKGFKHGGSVSSSSSGMHGINVIACSSPDDLPETAITDTIAVITDEEITGYMISNSDPANIIYNFSPTSNIGYVWVKTGMLDDALMQCSVGHIVLFPVVVYQLDYRVTSIDGNAEIGWKAKHAFIRQGSLWSEWITRLYLIGREYTNLTGGWTGEEGSDSYTQGTFTKSEYSMSIKTTSSTAIYAHTVNLIDLTDVKTIFVEIESVTGNPFVSVHAEGDLFDAGGRSAYQHFDSVGVISLDVSQLKGNYYVAVGAYGGAHSCTFDSVYMQYGG